VTREWSKERNPAKEAQGGDSSSRSVNLQIHFWMITIAAERKS